MSKYTISEVVKMIPVWHNIGMFKAMEDGDPKHNIDYQEKATKAIESLLTEARVEQDKHSRGDEFLWFMRKMEEYMYGSTTNKYKTFLASMKNDEKKHREYFDAIDKIESAIKRIEEEQL